MVKRRRSYETGHRPKFLAVVDDSPECAKAVRFAARRCARVGATIVLLGVVTPPAEENWLGVGEVMRAEAEAEAEALIAAAAATVRSLAGLEPEKVVRTGIKADEVVKLIEADEDISLLVLAAGTGSNGPGPLVSALAGKSAGTFPIPVAIVPGHLADEEIDALA
ncbi:universal stress protein [Bosea sp. (in: a-proteobacteria)]|jgi:nucleotide-binding universal stress UspA family protein|uniref:universal stress protein n=1 Tax=Bosea sp. (in: a-proteobacteria) TaxID=1871050 RepID=UPI0008687BA3|nr:universal stress protein [Bosea sp. (in: a-proteobacteria)]MBN9439950.1 universal stress protein [Bosea sp. (in: a-proteobacteria)]MBN9446806.1 universal stress protein [Bosea sp. (in: a-proteobacteria)]MBN9468915.1 universal stress protein [Bosea sp. (in: a-proteobacteria)]ODT46769.1 MAG: universal stress protein UspA [Methylobacterium sp. SCN 67-24]